jgi:3-deoxy-D-manno-octulosonate 8-phosphate phosphatase (KDO 8-P phosphatase)
MQLEQNIKGLCSKFGIDFDDFLNDLDVENVHELTVYDLEAVCEEYEIDLQALLFKPLFKPELYKKKLSEIKFLILDVDGVMTDGGMYISENGDQNKRFNAQDGMAIQHLVKSNFKVGIISSGTTKSMVQKRAEILGIQHCYVGTDSKISVLNSWCKTLGIKLSEVAIIGDDINDIEIMKKVGIAACPANAVNSVKSISHIQLSKKGGDACIREFIDNYLLKEPIQ